MPRLPKMIPCPFCGLAEDKGDPKIRTAFDEWTRDGNPKPPYSGYCERCGSSGPDADTMAEAVAAWNRRAGEDELRRRLADTLGVADNLNRTLKTLFDNASYAAAQKRPPSHLPVQPSTPSTPSTTELK